LDKLTWWKVHSRQRAQERYRITLSENVRREIIKRILRGDYVKKKRQGRSRFVYLVIYKDRIIKLVLNTRWMAIITFLKLEKPPLPL